MGARQKEDEKRFILAEPMVEGERPEGSKIPNVLAPSSPDNQLEELSRHCLKQV
jgi:hypothetical protein